MFWSHRRNKLTSNGLKKKKKMGFDIEPRGKVAHRDNLSEK